MASLPHPNRPSLAECWEAFLRKAVPPNAPAIQITEMRTAFYSGFFTAFGLVTGAGLDDSPEATAEDLAYLDRLQAEVM
ncbi:MAG TPA: hypothetical protein PK788_07645 [Gemmatimonadaceae bacterium]|nr:hypothetical protein [Gemmatimonadaceae bacterium]